MPNSSTRIVKLILAAGVALSVTPYSFCQENLGTSVGIPNTSPGVVWPRSFSLESLGTGRLYPNGPEFGLSTTAGGFGLIGTGRMTGIGLAERTVSGLAGAELDRPFSNLSRLNGAFSLERAQGSRFFSTALSSQFRGQIQRGSLGLPFDSGQMSPLVQPYQMPTVDAVLQDRPANTDSVLRTGL